MSSPHIELRSQNPLERTLSPQPTSNNFELTGNINSCGLTASLNGAVDDLNNNNTITNNTITTNNNNDNNTNKDNDKDSSNNDDKKLKIINAPTLPLTPPQPTKTQQTLQELNQKFQEQQQQLQKQNKHQLEEQKEKENREESLSQLQSQSQSQSQQNQEQHKIIEGEGGGEGQGGGRGGGDKEEQSLKEDGENEIEELQESEIDPNQPTGYTGKRRSSLQINEASPKLQTPSVDRTLCILDSLPCPIFQIGIIENTENGNITLTGFANERLTTLLSCSSNLLVDSLKSIPSPHYNTVPSLESCNSIPINNLAPGLLPNTDPSKILDPYISLYNKKQLKQRYSNNDPTTTSTTTTTSTSTSAATTTTTTTTTTIQIESDSNNNNNNNNNKQINKQHTKEGSEEVLNESTNSTGTGNSISRPNSILQCILDSFHEQKTITEKVLLSNFLIRQQYKSRATIKPFPDGCICIFEYIENINLNYQQPPTSLNDRINSTNKLTNEMELLSLSPDSNQQQSHNHHSHHNHHHHHNHNHNNPSTPRASSSSTDSPFLHSISANSLSSMSSNSSVPSSASASLSNSSSNNASSSNCSSNANSNNTNSSYNCSSSSCCCCCNSNNNLSSTSSTISNTSSTATSTKSKSYLHQQHKNSKVYSTLLNSFENLSFLLKSTPIIIWRADHNGEMVFFKKSDEIPIDEKKVVGNSFQDFLQWVPQTYRTNFQEMFQNNLKSAKIFEFLFWFQTPQNYVQLFKIAGYPIFHVDGKDCIASKKYLIGWLGVTYNYLINDGAEISIKGSANLDSMYEKFKIIYEMPNIERTKLTNNGISSGDISNNNNTGGSSESSNKILEKKKHLISEAEKECFLKCKETYNILFKLSLLGVMFSTFKGIILDANDMLLQTIGYTRGDLENGKIDWMLLTPPEHFEISARALQELKSKRWCQPIEKAYIHKSGKRVPVLITSAMIDGSTEQCITFVFDLSRYRQAEMAAIEATRLKTQFITNISHELRTPCHGIVGMSQLLLDSQLTSTQRDNIDSIKRSTDSLISLINDILDFSKLEYGKVTLENESFELLPMIEEVLDSQATAANQKGIDLIFVMGRDYPVPPVIFGDRNSLKKVLLNLVGNAVKFTETGFVLLEISTDYESGDQISLRFTVKDSGIGIPENKIEQIFVPFGQIDGSFSRKYGGSGLGLSFCKELVALMGGYIRVESGDQEGGKGTTFWFAIKVSISSPSYLPNSVPAANQFFYPEYRPSHYNNVIGNGDSPKNVLIIESNQMVIMSIQSILLSMKCECISASKAITALDLLESSKSTENQIDIIVCSDKSTFVQQILDYVTTEKVILYGVDPNSKYNENPKVYSYLVTPITHSKLISSILLSKLKSKNSFLTSNNNNNNNNNNNITENKSIESPLSITSTSSSIVTPTLTSNNLDLNINNNNNINSNNNNNSIITSNSGDGQQSTNLQTIQPSQPKKYILVAEDNDINIKVVVRQLEKLGYTAIVGINGLKALEIIGSVPICLILLDCQMPQMDGFTCSAILRQIEPTGQRIPIIAMTANDSKDRCFEVGMDDYLSKPVRVDRLQKTLSDWIKTDENGNPTNSYNFYPLSYSLVYNNFIDTQLKKEKNDD
ncbi:hypothetical protein ACTFIU_010972 [Dictyostelium citrinum]